ncbi:type III polyketide synthase [Kyrpidia tusciae]|uniref:Chalcone and stilbene synthase domain protein n=1 Tax=Kyrpidia tusciae (strain DSM 2912 / NBRC 15312 / T2) TaxID=562970 RepID=D5WSV2_KYRT2|nr:3-oxoacyl-[acyl-carrier-protein] synthase III C-terminal domain-containing protein [Kyrpidia tusciae]ADG07121.1 chalcone and stilbene synthase domain protein [Kyrpidia tusciae DSM 2912]
MPFLVHIATTTPPHRYSQEEVRTMSRELFRTSFRDIDRLLRTFDTAGIEWRHFCRPAEWYIQGRPFSARNAVYQEEAVALGTEAARTCLTQTGVDPRAITDLWWVSSTGLATPSPDMRIAQRLGLSGKIRRTPIWGLGCAGGAVGLSRGLASAAADPDAHVLVVVVELCSLTFLARDQRKSNLIATVLFADGAGAALILGDRAYERWSKRVQERAGSSGAWEWKGSHSIHWPDTEDMMGWEVGDDGWRVVFSRDIPEFLRRQKREHFAPAEETIDHWVVHPGGAKVLAAYEEVLGLNQESLESAHETLRQYGNMSAPTVLFVLKDLAERRSLRSGDRTALLALGPGFSSERVMLQWR